MQIGMTGCSKDELHARILTHLSKSIADHREHARYGHMDWRSAVHDGETFQGYRDWVEERLEEETFEAVDHIARFDFLESIGAIDQGLYEDGSEAVSNRVASLFLAIKAQDDEISLRAIEASGTGEQPHPEHSFGLLPEDLLVRIRNRCRELLDRFCPIQAETAILEDEIISL